MPNCCCCHEAIRSTHLDKPLHQLTLADAFAGLCEREGHDSPTQQWCADVEGPGTAANSCAMPADMLLHNVMVCWLVPAAAAGEAGPGLGHGIVLNCRTCCLCQEAGQQQRPATTDGSTQH